MKKMISLLLAAAMLLSFAGCSYGSNPADETPDTPSAQTPAAPSSSDEGTPSGFDTNRDITVISREDGSGTRGAFIELFGIEVKDSDGNKNDLTTEEAVIANKTDVMLTTVAGDPYALGYVSLGSLNDTVKAMKIDGVEATTENVVSGDYKVARPFMIATKGEASGLAKDFIDFILSREGQEVISDGYIMVNDAADVYAGTKPSGRIVVAGSSSVTPIMEKLREAYLKINPSAEIEVQQSDSTAGMQGAIDGVCDIGMASRELKDSEKEQLTGIQIAIDGIAVIANPQNTIDNLTSEQVNRIYTGEVNNWSEIA